MSCADANELLHIRRALWKYHRIRRLVRDPGGGVGVLLADGARGDQPVAEFCSESSYCGGSRLGIASAAGFGVEHCHVALTSSAAWYHNLPEPDTFRRATRGERSIARGAACSVPYSSRPSLRSSE